MAKYLDENGLLYYNQKINTKLGNKVDKETGKGLSTNDYTNDEKTKLSGIDSGAQVNVIESITVNGTAATISGKAASVTIDTGKIDTIKVNGDAQAIINKAVDITVPTKTSDITNDSNFAVDASYVHTDNNYTTTEKTKLSNIASNAQVNVIESIKVNGTAQAITSKAVDITVPTNNTQLTNGAGYQNSTQVQTAINNAIKDITGIDFQVVTELPATGVKGVIYLMSNGGTSPNVYDEYIWLSASSTYEKIGTTQVDLSGYWAKTELVNITNAEIDTIVS